MTARQFCVCSNLGLLNTDWTNNHSKTGVILLFPRLDLEEMLSLECEWVLNPATHCTWSDEDFIGRVSRVSRRSHVLTCALHTIQRCLGLYRRQWMGIGYTNPAIPTPPQIDQFFVIRVFFLKRTKLLCFVLLYFRTRILYVTWSFRYRQFVFMKTAHFGCLAALLLLFGLEDRMNRTNIRSVWSVPRLRASAVPGRSVRCGGKEAVPFRKN